MVHRLQQSVQKQWFWIQEHVQRFDRTASASDFADRIVERLADRLDDGVDPVSLDEAVRNTVRLLSYEDRRRILRREKLCRSSSEMNVVVDPESLSFAAEVEVESEIEFIRRQVSPDQFAILESLYGFEEEELTVDELADHLGMQPMAVYQKLHRLYVKLRRELRLRSRDTVS
jgi:hypothetical protein